MGENLVRIDLQKKTNQAEQSAFCGKYRAGFHLMPPVGWLNDPNGLCQFQGVYHVFFQYSPLEVNGGMKAWGHYVSQDLIHWNYVGTPFFPDEEFDKDGVYSGSALVDDKEIVLYYTGNVKQEGNYDYIYEGREANTVMIQSLDGKNFSDKKKVMGNEDYPSYYSCHIRDPKVWKVDDMYYMIQGGRINGKKWSAPQNDGNDRGSVLFFTSKDKEHWEFAFDITGDQPFGYMWECPDVLPLKSNNGEEKVLLSCSPQGVDSERYRFQNVYQSGYFVLDKNEYDDIMKNQVFDEISVSAFEEWDMGFDFYAPQTFENESGRRIIIGWIGIPDAEYDNEPSVKENWQHMLTVPREVVLRNGKVLQNPVKELETLRTDGMSVMPGENFLVPTQKFDLEIENITSKTWECILSDDTNSGWRLSFEQGELVFEFVGKEKESIGRGRKERYVKLDELKAVRILCDESVVEIYINGGEKVITSRYYTQMKTLEVNGECSQARFYKMQDMEIRITK